MLDWTSSTGRRIPALLACSVVAAVMSLTGPGQSAGAAGLSDASQLCLDCHTDVTPAIVEHWKSSRHSTATDVVGCFECHQAAPEAVDAWDHEGASIHVIVTPADCARCHQREAEESQQSHHAKGGQILGSLDNVLGEIIEGVPAATLGCKQCHGSEVALLKNADGTVRRAEDGKPLIDPKTWPNTGIGRINLDGSKGSCTACHSRHRFSVAVARNPENCGKCHMGPDHPHIEIYNESKHGIAFRAHKDEMNLDAKTWVLGQDYSVAPTCATCHMSANTELPVTHDPGSRISWTLRPVVSKKLEDWEAKRGDMQKTCTHCHTSAYVSAFYEQYDAAVGLYNDKFAIPAQTLMGVLKAEGLITPDPFDDEIEWTFFYLWHHEGRRARMGASMMGPDYTQWHGFFEVADRFYVEFIPQAEELGHGNAAVEKAIADIYAMPDHQWKKGMTPEQKAAIRKFYEDRYGK